MGVWLIWEDGEDFDYDCTYSIENYPDFFSMEVRHGDVLNEIAQAFGYHDTSKMIFCYLIPGRSLDNGLRVLACYDDFDGFMALTVDHNCLAFYVDHDKILAEDGPVDEDDDGGDDNVDEDDDDDYDILDDDSFEKEDVEVDMKDFKLNFSDDDAADEDYMSNDSFGTSGSEEDDKNLKRRRKALRKLRKNQQGCKDPCTFYVGQTFATNDEVKALIKKHSVETRRELRLYRNDQERVRTVCKGPIPTFEKGPNETDSQGPSDKRKKINSGKHVGPSQKDGGKKTLEDPNKCPWLLYVSRLSGEPTWMVKTYNPQHRCLLSRSVKAFTSDWIAKQILVEVESNPGIPIKAIREQVEKMFDLILREDLGLEINANFTFISDRQKGIIPAIAYEFPSAQHRYCVRYILQNMKLQWRGKADKDMLWGIATITTVEYFTKKMEELKEMNEGCYKWLSQIPHVHWTRSHFTGRAKTDVLDKKFEIIKNQAAKLTVKWNGGSKYQVTGFNGEHYVVDVVEKVCSCRNWELLSIPCKHAVAANWDMALNGMEVDIPKKWVDMCFWLDTWKDVYSHKVEPINGRCMWPKSKCPTELKEPIHHKPIGRPRKMRKNDALEKDDDMVKNGKLTRRWNTVTCSKCGKKGHNKKTCRGQSQSSSNAA
ncbi:hypothetical protein E3N88_21012 [Mikania micrantha]|uniref:SWIM-type domain-containing protein n=1 Tax=Mikania micrantha TaxID=192012 RepID=A0A5N6NK22_9ASTR|nr:hypothetical protein E3N88_21012 [Mikania micrantha]